jgi:hypothetical protein
MDLKWGMSSPLSNLISMICDGRFISRQTVQQCIQETYGYLMPLEEGAELILYEYDLVEAVQKLVDGRRAMVAMAREVDPLCPSGAMIETATRRLIKGLGLTLLPEVRLPLGADSIQYQLKLMREEIDEIERSDAMSPSHLRSFPLDGWSYVEHLLRSTIDFYASVLVDFGEAVEQSFEVARNRRSLRPVLQAMRSIENQFTSIPENFTEQVERDMPIDQIERDRLIEQAERDRFIGRRNDLTSQFQHVFGRNSPFEGFNFDDYDNALTVNTCRNFYAHSIREAVETEGVQAARKSIDVTINLVNDLMRLKIAPSVVFITAHGRDEYGREILWFVKERDIHLSAKKRRARELRMFKKKSEEFNKLEPYFTVTPTEDGMYDLPMVPVHLV